MPKITITKEDTTGSFGSGQVNPIVTEGTYPATVTAAKFETDEQKREKVVIDFKVADGNGNASGQTFRKWLYLHQPETKRISIENMENLGTPDGWSYKNTKDLVGKQCRIQVQKSNNSTENSEVKSILQRFVPPGVYKTKIVHVGDKDGKIEQPQGNAHPFVRVIYKIMEGPMVGLKVMDRLFINDRALGVTAAKLGNMGVPVGDFDFDNQRDRQSLIGLWVNLTYAEETLSDGKKVGRIRKFEKLGRLGASAATSVAVAAAPSSKVTVSASDVAGTAPLVDASSEYNDTDDDVPFSNP